MGWPGETTGWDQMTELVITIALVLTFVGALWASGLVYAP